MIVIASKEEKELIQRLRKLEPLGALSEEVIRLKKDVSELEIKKAQMKEVHDREERELRHMIGLEKKRQEVEMAQAKRDAILGVREENLKAQQARFEEQLKFNTERFEKMETHLKSMISEVLTRLPNVNLEIVRGQKRA